MILKEITLLVLCLFSAAQCTQQGGGIRAGILARINPTGFAFVSQTISQLNISELLEIFDLDSFSSQGSSFQVSEVEIQRLDVGDFVLQSSPSDGVTLSTSGLSFSSSARVSATIFFFTFSADVLLTVQDLSFSQAISLTRHQQHGGFSASAGKCGVSIGDVSLSFGKGSPFNSFASQFKNQIRDIAKQWLCSSIRDVINEQSFSEFSSFGLPYNVTIDLGLASNPIIGNNVLELALNGRCFPNSFPSFASNIPIPHIPFLSASERGNMFQISVNEFVFNTYLQSLSSNNVFAFEVDQKQMNSYIQSSSMPFNLTLDFFALFNPSLTQYTVNTSTQFTIKVESASPPRLEISSNLLTMKGDFFLSIRIPEENVEVYLFQTNFTITARVAGAGRCIQYRVIDASVDFTGAASFILQQFQQPIEAAIPDLLNSVISSSGNRIRLPSFLGYHLDNFNLHLRENAIEMSGNIEADGESAGSVEGCVSLEVFNNINALSGGY